MNKINATAKFDYVNISKRPELFHIGSTYRASVFSTCKSVLRNRLYDRCDTGERKARSECEVGPFKQKSLYRNLWVEDVYCEKWLWRN